MGRKESYWTKTNKVSSYNSQQNVDNYFKYLQKLLKIQEPIHKPFCVKKGP